MVSDAPKGFRRSFLSGPEMGLSVRIELSQSELSLMMSCFLPTNFIGGKALRCCEGVEFPLQLRGENCGSFKVLNSTVLMFQPS